MAGRSDALHLIVKAILIAALAVILIIAAGRLVDLFVLVFGATVIAVLLSGFADAIERRSGLSRGWSFAAAMLIILAVLSTLIWQFGTRIGFEFARLSEILPSAWAAVKERIVSFPGGQQLISSLEQGAGGGELLSRILGLVRTLANLLLDMILLLFGAIFIASNPGLYRRGMVMLVPKAYRPVADQALCESGRALRKWMLGQLASMVIIGSLTGAGLWLIGVPSAVALGLVAGLAEIIPWAGPILASIPIMIVAIAAGPDTALQALALVVIIQQTEGKLIMPYIQKKAVSLPPALTVFGVVAGGLLFGPLGLIFAAPMLVVAFVLVNRLYVEETLDTETEIPGASGDSTGP